MQSLDIDFSNMISASLDLSKCLIESDVLPVIFCIGESGSGAVLSKMIAELLVLKYNIKAYVYGRNKSDINKSNLKSAVSWAEQRHKGSKIILIVSRYVGEKEEDLIYYGKGKSLIGCSAMGDYCFLVGINSNKIWGGKQISLNKLADKTAKIINNGIIYSAVLKDCNKKINMGIVWSV